MPEKALNCIVCKMDMPSLLEGEPNHPNGGVVFQARGNYGSTVFDPFDGSYLEINVCDTCLLTAKHDNMVMIGVRPIETDLELRPWRDND